VREGSHPAIRWAPLPDIDTTVTHSARVWDYWLGGKNNYPVDREAGEQIRAVMPGIVDTARAVRGFLNRAVQHLVGEVGIRQLLDIGTGLPTVNNTHAVAQATAPECRVVYADNDPLVLAHARALLTSTPEGATNYVDADLRDTDRIVREAAKTLDFTQPIALMLLGVLNHIMDTDEANTIVDRLLAALPSGSYLVMSHFTSLADTEVVEEGMRIYNESGGNPPVRGRSRQELLRYFDGLELLEPGLVSVSLWRPDPSDLGVPVEVYEFCGVGRKP
jgi:O-methyltransferase involved in polyketide biosynthesis